MLAFRLGCLFLQAYGECRDNEGCEAFRVCRHGGCFRSVFYYIEIIAKNVEFYNFVDYDKR